MEFVIKPDLKSKTYITSEHLTLLREKEKGLINIKFYQKLFVILISFSTLLIFPESPRELANICESYNSGKLCNVW